MKPELAPWVLLLFSFFLGSVPFGLFIVRAFYGGDLRSSGSGNVGATNVSRVAGFWPAGAITFFLDLAKGAIPPALVLYGDRSWVGVEPTATLAWACGLCAVLGHCYTPWLRFRGGKGVSTCFGALLVLSPIAAAIGMMTFAAFFFYSRIGSLSSIAGVLAAAAAHLILFPTGQYVLALGAIVFVILVRHESNLEALLQGRERTFDKRSS